MHCFILFDLYYYTQLYYIYKLSYSLMKHDVYRTVRNIGGGNFGRVDLVESQQDSTYYVMKKLKLSQQNRASILKQIEIMQSLCHQYVVRYHESFLDPLNENVCIVMEYAQNGELEKYLNTRKSNNNPLSEEEVLEWFIQLCHGLKYIHDQRILHRDLKCENILISAAGEIKIGDFGISKDMQGTFQMAQTKIGTPFVMAPEIWENKLYNQKSDIWSLGCILYKMMTFNQPFESKNPGAYVLKITSGVYAPITGSYSEELKNLVKCMLSLDAHNRPSVHSILQMQFIKKRSNQVLQSTLRKYLQSIQTPTLTHQKSTLSNNRLLSQKRSFSSLSNSSMLTPKNTNTFNNTKIVQLKQSYPVLVQEVNKLKEKVQEDGKKKQVFAEYAKSVIGNIYQKLDKNTCNTSNNSNNSGKYHQAEVRLLLEKLAWKIQQLIQA